MVGVIFTQYEKSYQHKAKWERIHFSSERTQTERKTSIEIRCCTAEQILFIFHEVLFSGLSSSLKTLKASKQNNRSEKRMRAIAYVWKYGGNWFSCLRKRGREKNVNGYKNRSLISTASRCTTVVVVSVAAAAAVGNRQTSIELVCVLVWPFRLDTQKQVAVPLHLLELPTNDKKRGKKHAATVCRFHLAQLQ